MTVVVSARYYDDATQRNLQRGSLKPYYFINAVIHFKSLIYGGRKRSGINVVLLLIDVLTKSDGMINCSFGVFD